jgi:hypothetical protein
VLPSDKSFYFVPAKVSMHFLDPIYIKEDDTADSIKQRVFEVMEKFILENKSKWT